jgi:2-polyprenyl-6-methoxyphenol hydroxylase-like FAD-dependent oxidoreductase
VWTSSSGEGAEKKTDMTEYDAIVVGARCAGSPTAMLLARSGHRVLLVDRASFPSDTVSTHVVHPQGVARLRAWGLLDRLTATGCPPVHTYSFDFGPVTIAGSPGTAASPVAYAPRRTVLDKLLSTPPAKPARRSARTSTSMRWSWTTVRRSASAAGGRAGPE